ncbi:helix-turn-helix domain-containing protein [Levilactobacillus brevis]|uniref:helix-turn-helix domain-containing protein n=1 Tax=Levilactobacillus brevis TaxID=1580 RepID=UPI000E09C4F9|nr:helix-turn-helix transcriptional regulator [Levilactobacillus brevis]RDF82043.1 XRE family transcriptional regulator [Levilactobacillus brevis]
MNNENLNFKKELLSLGSKVRYTRESVNLSQERLAEKIGIHRTYVGMIERGEKNPTFIMLLRFSKALNISVTELVNFK